MTNERRAMMAAIREASSETALFKGSSLSNGLRCIRTFERVNRQRFDPRNDNHLSIVRGMGVHEQLFRTVRQFHQADAQYAWSNLDTRYGGTPIEDGDG